LEKKYNSKQVQSLEDRSKKPHQLRTKVARIFQVEAQVCQIRRKYPYFGKEKIKKILDREDGINISASSVGRILSQYRTILPNMEVQKNQNFKKEENPSIPGQKKFRKENLLWFTATPILPR
jgi:transposase